jgi:hypothetical protein
MPLAERRAAGFPVEVAVFDPERIKSRPGFDGDRILSFTFAPDTTNDGIFCDSPGERGGSIAWGLTLDPVTTDGDEDVQASALYIETTGEELLHLIACLQSLYDVNYRPSGEMRDVDDYTPASHKHTDFCPKPTGHPGDCWEASNRARGIKPGPAITVKEV